MPNYNPRLIKSRRSYSIGEISSLFGINRRTCYRWQKYEGLRVIEKNVNPVLVMGEDLISFIKRRRAKNKITLGEDEFLCMKCHVAVKARVGSERTVKTGKRIGKDNLEQLNKTGICEICETKLNKFLRVYQQD